MNLDRQSAREIRLLVQGQKMACLSTIYRSGTTSAAGQNVADFPFGSLVPFLVDAKGAPVIFISKIAEHCKNLEADARASLLITDAFSVKDPAGAARVTLMVLFRNIDPPGEAKALLSTVPPDIAANFLFFRGEIKRIRWIGGFGKISWIEPAEWEEIWSTAD